MRDEQNENGAAASGAAQTSPLAAIYPGESIDVAGRTIWVRPWGVKALMTEVPAVLGRLMAKLAPLFEMLKGGTLAAEDILSFLMQNSAGEVIEFVAWSIGLREAEIEAMSAGDFLKLARAVIRQNRSFFDQLGGMYEDLGQEIKSGLAGIGSRSSSPSEVPGSPSTS